MNDNDRLQELQTLQKLFQHPGWAIFQRDTRAVASFLASRGLTRTKEDWDAQDGYLRALQNHIQAYEGEARAQLGELIDGSQAAGRAQDQEKDDIIGW